MAFNVRSGGKATSVPVANTIKSGDLVRVGDLIGIAEIDATVAPDGNYYTTLALDGVAHVAMSGTAVVGDVLSTATASGKVTPTKGATAGNKAIGIVTAAKATGDDVWFKLVQSVGTL